MIRVEIDMAELPCVGGDAIMQFVVRQKLKNAGIPLGPWGSSSPARGEIAWVDDRLRQVRIVEWRESVAASPTDPAHRAESA